MSKKAFATITGNMPNNNSDENIINTHSKQNQSNVSNQSNVYPNQSNIYPNQFIPPNISAGNRDDFTRISDYKVLDNFDQDTLYRMSSNTVDFSSPLANSSYEVRQVPPYSNFVQPREPSLNVGMTALPIHNPSVLPHQLHTSLDLLAQTDQLAISTIHKRSNLLDTSHIVNSNEIEEQMEKIQGIAAPYSPYDEYSKPDAYFNNFTGEGRLDYIKEHICHVNSIDRDINKYPNPFNFLVKFAPLAGDTNASISRTFENIRYVKIETAVLPRKYYVTKKKISNHPEIVNTFPQSIKGDLVTSNTIIKINNPLNTYCPYNYFVVIHSFTDIPNNKQHINYTYYEPDISKTILISFESIRDMHTNDIVTYQYDLSPLSIENDKYTILYLNDINDISQFSTDIALSKAFNVFYPDILAGDSLYVDCKYADKIYKYSKLGIMTKMRLILTNSMGKELSTNVKAQDKMVPNINLTSCICTTDPETGNITRDFKCLCNYIRHPRFIKSQINLMFKIGTVETDFDKRVFN